jgi:hypothetical protein
MCPHTYPHSSCANQLIFTVSGISTLQLKKHVWDIAKLTLSSPLTNFQMGACEFAALQAQALHIEILIFFWSTNERRFIARRHPSY